MKPLISILGIICFVAALLSYFVYPDFFVMQTYMSENALQPAWGQYSYTSSSSYANLASQLSEAYYEFQLSLPKNYTDGEWSKVTSEWILQLAKSHYFSSRVISFPRNHPSATTSAEKNDSMYMVDIVLEGPRASGVEAVIFTARFDRLDSSVHSKPPARAAYSFALLLSFFKMMQHQHWRSKDLMLVLTPAPAGTSGASFWIDQLNDFKNLDSAQKRLPFIFASFTLDIPPLASFPGIAVKTEGEMGQAPNLDLVNTIFRVAWRAAIKELTWTHSYGNDDKELPLLGMLSAAKGGFIPVERISQLRTLWTFMKNMAIGSPTGDHSVIGKYKIESVTIAGSGNENQAGSANVRSIGMTLEGSLRSINNLIEPLHQSFFYYFPLGAFSFVPIGHYMISFGLMFVPTALWLLLTLMPSPGPLLLYSILRVIPAFLLSFLMICLSSVTPFQFLAKTYGVSFDDTCTLIAMVIPCWTFLSLFMMRLLSAYNPYLETKNDQVKDLMGCLALTPLMLFLAAASLLNAPFAMFATLSSLPFLTLVLLKRPNMPTLARLALAFIAFPLILFSIIWLLWTPNASMKNDHSPFQPLTQLVSNLGESSGIFGATFMTLKNLISIWHQHNSLLYLFLVGFCLPAWSISIELAM